MENGKYSEGFLLWCRKTERLSDDAWKRGFEIVEFNVKDAAKSGDEYWPPSYAAFLGYCEPPVGSIAHRYFPRLGIPDKTSQERSKAAGSKELEKMKSMFN
mgnify:CR=1 FL=1